MMLSNADFWFLDELRVLNFELFESEFFHGYRLRVRKDQLFSQLPIAVRLNELNLDVFLMVFSNDVTLLDANSILEIEPEFYEKWDKNTQTGYVLFEWLYHFKNNDLMWKDPTKKIINEETMYELPLVMNIICVLEQYHNPNYQSDRSNEFNQCQNKAVHFFYDAYSLKKKGHLKKPYTTIKRFWISWILSHCLKCGIHKAIHLTGLKSWTFNSEQNLRFMLLNSNVCRF